MVPHSIVAGTSLPRRAALFCAAALFALLPTDSLSTGFTDVSAAAGLNVQNGNVGGWGTEAQKGIGGVGCGDYDNDGWIDLYIVSGDAGSNKTSAILRGFI